MSTGGARDGSTSTIGIAAVAVGVAGILFPVVSPVALHLGGKAVRDGTAAGDTQAATYGRVGRTLGWVGLVLLVTGLMWIVGWTLVMWFR